METTASFGYWIRRQRKALDFTQQTLAKQVGCSLAAIKKIESDERRPSRQIAERLADVLSVPADQREIFLEVARGLRPVDQLLLAHEPARSSPAALEPPKSFPHNLPIQLTSFIGREREMAELRHLLETTRLLTLTGPGGTGKTRLALQLATEVLEAKQFAEGVWLVELAPLTDPTLVTQTMAATLGVREQPGRTLLDALTDYVRAKSMLLILDNCEHLVQACAQIAESLLHTAPRLKILATSRESLGIAGETSYRVPSLPLPDPQHLHDLDALARNDCVHLFVDRALAAYPSFHLKEKNASAIADICRRLDGIPLAIELASARTKIFPPEEIAARLDDRFRLLTGGSRTALERHQTLFALIEWSHNLLSDTERVFLRRLSVFAGGWSFEAAQAVCSEGIDEEVLDLLTHLVDKSLVAVEEQMEEGRYRLPETIRQYARNKLFESGEAEVVRDRHLDFFLHFAEAAEPKLRSAEQLEWLERLETEHDNLRTALAWSLESGKSARALQLAGALYYAWELSGYWSEGQMWLNQILSFAEREQGGNVMVGELSDSDPAATARRAKALYAAARMHYLLLDFGGWRTLGEESLRLWRELGDKWWIAVTLELVGVLSLFEGDQITARARFEEGVSLARQVEDRWPLMICLARVADVTMRTDVTAAHSLVEEVIAMARSVGDKTMLGGALLGLAVTYLIEGNLTEAASVAEEALVEAGATRGNLYVLISLMVIVAITCFQGDQAKARSYCFQVLAIARETGNPLAALFVIFSFGALASISGQPGRTVRLLAAAEAWAQQRGLKINILGGPVSMLFNRIMEIARSQLDPATFESAWANGQQMTPEQALALATEDGSENLHLPGTGLGTSSAT